MDKEYLFFLELFSSINVGLSLFLNNVEAINPTGAKLEQGRLKASIIALLVVKIRTINKLSFCIYGASYFVSFWCTQRLSLFVYFKLLEGLKLDKDA